MPTQEQTQTGTPHTPTPWHSAGRFICNREGIAIAECFQRGTETPNPEANAAFIVTACNAALHTQTTAQAGVIGKMREALLKTLPIVAEKVEEERTFWGESDKHGIAKDAEGLLRVVLDALPDDPEPSKYYTSPNSGAVLSETWKAWEIRQQQRNSAAHLLAQKEGKK